jgi:hypothetical protein
MQAHRRSLRRRVMAEVHFTSWLRELVPDGPLKADGGGDSWPLVGAHLPPIYAVRLV